MKLSNLSFVFLFPIACSLSAMDHSGASHPAHEIVPGNSGTPSHALAPAARPQQPENLTGLAGLTDHVGTACQHLLFPVAATAQACRHEKVTVFITSILMNELLLHCGQWLIDWPRTSRIATYPESTDPDQETKVHYVGRKTTNGAIHLANQGTKIATSIVPWIIFTSMLGKH